MAPRELRVSRPGLAGSATASSGDALARLRLTYRPPVAWGRPLTFVRRDAVDGIDVVEAGRYARTVELDGHTGFVLVENAGAAAKGGRPVAAANSITTDARRRPPVGLNRMSHVSVSISQSLVPVLMPLLARLRQLFDLDAQPTVIDAHLAQGHLRELVARHAGIRIPGSFDGFDVALRAILRG